MSRKAQAALTTTARGERILESANLVDSDVSLIFANSPSSAPARSQPFSFRNAGIRKPTPRLNVLASPGSIIMTKAQIQRRRSALIANQSNIIRTIQAADTGPVVTTRNNTVSSTPARNPVRRRIISLTSANDSGIELDATMFGGGPLTSTSGPVRIIRAAKRVFANLRGINDQTSSTYAMAKYKRNRNRVTFDLGDSDGKDSMSKVLASEKIFPLILELMNWNELLPLRGVCKAWFHMISSHPKISTKHGVIVLRPSVEPKMKIYNDSIFLWTKFRFIGPVIFDMTKTVQNEFWSKHGPKMVHLDIQNRTMSLTALVELLSRCPKLEFFKCNWTPEMYSFNSDLIKKYYGIHFNNGTFANLQELIVDSSSSLTDSALWSILKWCGGSIKSLKLTSTPDEDILNRLKPRWSMDSVKNYCDRFGYTGNLQYLDFSWSNLTNNDMRSMCAISTNLKGIILNYCKIDDEALHKLLHRHGESLEIFKIEGTSFTDLIFSKPLLPNVKVLHIGGLKGVLQTLSFLKDMPYLEDLSCRNTQWLEQNMILRPFISLSRQSVLRIIDFSGGIKHVGNRNLDPNLNRSWFSDFTGLLSNVSELNLGHWSSFGTNQNFKNICQTLTLLEKLTVRGWNHLTDVGTTGLYEEEIHQDWGEKASQRPRAYIGLLKGLKYLDLSETSITDATIFLGLFALKNLRSLALENTSVTDKGLRGVINGIPSLDKVSVERCRRISVTQPRFKRTDGRMVFFGKI